MENREIDSQQLERLKSAREKLHKKPIVSKNPLWLGMQKVVYFGIVIPILRVVITTFFGLKRENRSVLRKLKGQGYVIVCNHVHPLDCVFIGLTAFPRHVTFTSQEETFYVRGLGGLMRVLNCVPILKGVQGLRRFLDAMENKLKKGRVITMYPEGEIYVCCDHLRKFNDGAFTLATKAQVPVVPMVITPRERRGVWKLLRREYCFTITVGDPILPPSSDSDAPKRVVRQLRDQTFDAMNVLLENGGHAYPKEDPNNKDAFWQIKKSKGL